MPRGSAWSTTAEVGQPVLERPVRGLADLGLLVEVAGLSALVQPLKGGVDRGVPGRGWWLPARSGRVAVVHGHDVPAELARGGFADLAVDFLAVDVLAVDFLAVDVLVAELEADFVAFLVAAFLVAAFVVAAFVVAAFVVAAFFVAALFVEAFVVEAFFVVAAFFVAAACPATALRGGRRRGGAAAGSSTGAVSAASTTSPSSADCGLDDAIPLASVVAAAVSAGREVA
jgi:hypothetical protein